LFDESPDESGVSAVGRWRARVLHTSSGVLLSALVGRVASALPPSAVGHVKGIARGDDGLWSASAPVPYEQSGVVPRRLPEESKIIAGLGLGSHGASGGGIARPEPGEVRLELVQVVVGCGAEHLEAALASAEAGLRADLGVELVRE